MKLKTLLLFVLLMASNAYSQDASSVGNQAKGDKTNQQAHPRIYNIGDFAQGGIVFWVDETGQHGLVCSKIDYEFLESWGGDEESHAGGDGIYAGKANTLIIVCGNGSNTSAASFCVNLQVTENEVAYGDWYLPSKHELNLIYLNKTIIDATAIENDGWYLDDVTGYWSSTSSDDKTAWTQDFSNGQQVVGQKYDGRMVRAIRSF